jgi:RHS repeat-associated protein
MTVNATDPVNFILDGQNVVQEWVDANENEAIDAGETVTYLNGPRGPEYRLDEIADPDVLRWYLYDGLGSVVAEVDEDGDVTYTSKYDVYGALRGYTGTSNSFHKFVGSLGHTTEPDTGDLIYMRARWMDPVLGRFISEDLEGDGDNWYLYCNNNPVNNVDPTGEVAEYLWLEAESAHAAISAGFAGAGLAVICIYGRQAIIQAFLDVYNLARGDHDDDYIHRKGRFEGRGRAKEKGGRPKYPQGMNERMRRELERINEQLRKIWDQK